MELAALPHTRRQRLVAGLTLLAGALLVLLVLLVATPAAGQAASILLTEARGPITPVVADHLKDAVAEAQRGGHGLLLIELDTPGGLESSMRDIVQSFLNSEVPVVVYIAPAGARAASAGFIILTASHVAAMSPGTTTGSATPILMEGEDRVVDKIVEDAAAYAEALAELRGRDVEFAIAAVREGLSVTATRAVEQGTADILAASRGELFAAIDGRTVTVIGDREVTIRTAGATVTTFEMSWTRALLQRLADPNIAFLFLSIGTLAIIYELANPTFGGGGIIGVILIVLALFALAVLPVNLAGLVLLFVAIALFIAELFVPGVGIMAGLGTVTLLVAGLFLFQRPTGVGVDLTVLLPTVVLAGLGTVFLGRLAWRTRHAPSVTGGEGMVGRTGVVRHADGDRGQVFVEGALWRASTADGSTLEPGTRIVVVGRDGLDLVVEPEVRSEMDPATGSEGPDK